MNCDQSLCVHVPFLSAITICLDQSSYWQVPKSLQICESSTMSSTKFKCNSCAIQFLDSDAQRYHMKTDWHRYNLKRRVVGLTPVDAAIFAEKLNQSQKNQEEVDEFGFKVLPEVKEGKKEGNAHQKAALHIHQTRGRHAIPDHARDISPVSVASEMSHFSLGESVYSKAGTHSDIDSNFDETGSEIGTQASFEDDYQDLRSDTADEEATHTDEEESYETSIQPITSCIFCGVPHREVETNVNHMFRSHGLYIPERSYLFDLKGLLEYLISIIVLENECLCCNFKGKNLESIRAHTSSKGHCRLPYETKEERAQVAKFYDFSSINSEVKASKSKKRVGFSNSSDQELTGEDVSENSSDSDEDESDGGINDNYTIATVDPIDSQLMLPNGQRLGHRSLQRYYRQNLHMPVDPSQGQLTVSTADRRVGGGLTLQEHKKQEKEIQLMETRLKSKRVVRDVRRANFQPHYRDPMLGG